MDSIVRADNEWRFDPVDGAFTVVALNRRWLPPPPRQRSADERALGQELPCPFCASADTLSTPDDPFRGRLLDHVERGAVSWVAIPSPTPLAFVEAEVPPATPYTPGPALGAHELLVPLGAPHHAQTLADLSATELSGLITLFARRALDLREDRRLQSVSLALLPASCTRLEHLHAAVLARPFPGYAAREAALCAVCQDIRAADATGRVLHRDADYVAYVPYAPRHTVHIRIAASHHGGASSLGPLEHLESADAADSLGAVVMEITNQVQGFHRGLPLALTLNALPLGREQAGAHLLFELTCPVDADAELAASLRTRIVTFLPEALANLLRTSTAG